MNSFLSSFGEILSTQNPVFVGGLAVLAVSLLSFLGALLFIFSKKRLQRVLPYLVSVSVGALVGDALLHLLPEAFSKAANSALVGGFVIGGFIIFLILEHALHWHHSHGEDEENHHHGEEIHSHGHVGNLIVVASAAHNFLDGIIIALGFALGTPIGIATTLAIVLHEIPHEMGDVGLLLYIGWSKRRAIILNFISALFACAGYALVTLLGQYTDLLQVYLPYFLAAAAGGFLYIAGADLIPELRKNHRSDFVKHIIVILLGVVAMAGLLLLE